MAEPDYKVDRRVFETTTLDAPSDDKFYWLSRTPAERMEALQFLREVNYGKDAARGPVERVLSFAVFSNS
jgi:hypothetical protein